MDVESCVAPGENPLGPLGAEEFLVDKGGEHFSGKKLSQSGVVDSGDLVEGPRLICAALGHQEMEMRAEQGNFSFFQGVKAI